jgi:hypothetical protein
MGLFSNFKLFRLFKKTINLNKVELEANFGIRIDRAYRLYTVLNIPEELYGEPYNLRKSDIDKISETYVREYINKLSDYLNSKGIPELYDFYEPIKKVEKYSYLIILGFKPFDTTKYYNFIYFRLIPISIMIFLISLILFIII